MSQKIVYLKGFNKVENSILFPDDAEVRLRESLLDLATVKSWIKVRINSISYDTTNSEEYYFYKIGYRINDTVNTTSSFFNDTYLSTYKDDNFNLFAYYMLYSAYKIEDNNYVKVDELKYLVGEEKDNRPINFHAERNSLYGKDYYIPYNIENFVFNWQTKNVDPKYILGLSVDKIIFNDDPWLSDSDTGQDINEDTEYMTLHLKSIHSFNFWQEDVEEEINNDEPEEDSTSEPNTGGGGEG